jgi:hypothetical protein
MSTPAVQGQPQYWIALCVASVAILNVIQRLIQIGN